mgnify:CR=1 FL=1
MANKSDSPGGRRRLFSMKRRARGGQGDGSGMSDKRQQIRAGKRAANNKGCSSKSKLFMLVLPLIAVGAYLLHLA